MAHWPQLLTLGFCVLVFASHCEHSGKPRPPYNPTLAFLGIVIEVTILWNGGYFAPLGWGAP